MKRYLILMWKRYLLLMLVSSAILTITGIALGEIEWRVHDKPILQLRVDGETVELGLRDDGVVVWRKITQTTNSPSEHVPEYWPIPKPWTLTNIVITNIFIDPRHWWSTNGGVIDVQKEYYDDLIPKVR